MYYFLLHLLALLHALGWLGGEVTPAQAAVPGHGQGGERSIWMELSVLGVSHRADEHAPLCNSKETKRQNR